MKKFTLKKLVIFFMLLFTSLAVFSQNFGEFIVNSHIDEDHMKLLYANCDSLDIIPVFHYFYSDDPYLNDDAKERHRAISPSFSPCGSINGVPITTNSYLRDRLWDINKWIPLLHTDISNISFDASSHIDHSNVEESSLVFNIINIQNLEIGDIVYLALVQDDENGKRNVQMKMMPSALGFEYKGEKQFSTGMFWPKNLNIERCSVISWVEKTDGSVPFVKEFPVLNEYIDQEPTLNYELTCPNAIGEPTVLNWWFLDLSSSTDYEDDIYERTMQASVKWEDNVDWTPYSSIKKVFEYRYRLAGTYTPTFKLIDSYGNVVTGSKEVTVGWITGVENIFDEQEVKMFPNPFVNEINIESNDLIKSIYVYDVVGKKVFVHNNINNPIYKLSTNDFFSGIYFIRIEYAEPKIKDTIYKVVKN